MLGMNSPKKQRQETSKSLQALPFKGIEAKATVSSLAKKSTQKVVGFGSSVPMQSLNNAIAKKKLANTSTVASNKATRPPLKTSAATTTTSKQAKVTSIPMTEVNRKSNVSKSRDSAGKAIPSSPSQLISFEDLEIEEKKSVDEQDSLRIAHSASNSLIREQNGCV